jgi:hypothetical protein
MSVSFKSELRPLYKIGETRYVMGINSVNKLTKRVTKIKAIQIV